jgi:hypothetical protein
MGRGEPASALHESPDQRVRDAERGVRNHVEVATGQAKVGRVCLDDGDARPEARPQLGGTTRMELDGDDAGSRLHQRVGEGSPTGAHVEHEVAGAEVRVSDELTCPSGIELMPSPCPLWRGHGFGRSSRMSWG